MLYATQTGLHFCIVIRKKTVLTFTKASSLTRSLSGCVLFCFSLFDSYSPVDQGGLAIYRGRQAGRDGRPGKSKNKSISFRHGIKTVTPAFICYVAMLVSASLVYGGFPLIHTVFKVRFALSSQCTFSPGGSGGSWPFEKFY